MEQQKWDNYKELDIKYLYSKDQPSKDREDRFMETMRKVLDENDEALKRLADK